MDSFTEAWRLICDYCKTKITEVAYNTWISRIEPVNLDFSSGTAVLKVPNDFHRKTITHYYLNTLQEAFLQVFGTSDIKIDLRTDDELVSSKPVEDKPTNEDYEYTFDT
ncbi:MAG TPA: chromosomal replication initiator protein DnaA, partial [Ruminococcaceae bacterium]|nr:chromosomal replication initiator protein DnaA [Oscillospiraceae bacterium]